jgi:hypothetical protein
MVGATNVCNAGLWLDTWVLPDAGTYSRQGVLHE